MDDQNEQRSAIKEFFRLVTATFTLSIIAMSISGLIFGERAREVTVIVSLAGEGISYIINVQLLAFSVVNSGISVFISSAKIFKNIMLMWQLVITLFLCLIASSIMISIFNWIRLDSWIEWLIFVTSFVVIFVVIAIIMIVKIRLENDHYNNLLSDYKNRQKKKELIEQNHNAIMRTGHHNSADTLQNKTNIKGDI